MIASLMLPYVLSTTYPRAASASIAAMSSSDFTTGLFPVATFVGFFTFAFRFMPQQPDLRSSDAMPLLLVGLFVLFSSRKNKGSFVGRAQVSRR